MQVLDQTYAGAPIATQPSGGTSVCVTELSAAALMCAALVVSAVLWGAVLAVL